uniref:BESS domain-containing protein n=1 Tax=Macrostomum lignano TaxID=282301 RepID=A0A1I8F3S2_9PLAT
PHRLRECAASIIPIAKRRCRKRLIDRQQQQQRPSTDAQHLDDEQLSVEDDSSTVGVDSSLNNCLAVAADQLLHIQHPIKIQQQQQPPTSQKKAAASDQLTVMPRRQLDRPPPPSDVVDAGDAIVGELPAAGAADDSEEDLGSGVLRLLDASRFDSEYADGGWRGGCRFCWRWRRRQQWKRRFWQVRPADGPCESRKRALLTPFLAAMKDIFRRLKDIGSNERARRFTSRMKTQEAAKLEELLQREFVSSEDEDDDRKQVRVSAVWPGRAARPDNSNSCLTISIFNASPRLPSGEVPDYDCAAGCRLCQQQAATARELATGRRPPPLPPR